MGVTLSRPAQAVYDQSVKRGRFICPKGSLKWNSFVA
jgi:hypothetical protein